eukprot:4044283-Prymnesium_polylepis.1
MLMGDGVDPTTEHEAFFVVCVGLVGVFALHTTQFTSTSCAASLLMGLRLGCRSITYAVARFLRQRDHFCERGVSCVPDDVDLSQPPSQNGWDRSCNVGAQPRQGAHALSFCRARPFAFSLV